MNSIANYINEERDVLHVRGQRRAKEEMTSRFVEKSLPRGKATVEEIAEDVGVSVDYVLDIQQQLSQNT